MTGPVARAYVNHGRWIADCPRPHCGNAEQLGLWQQWFRCSSRWCQLDAAVEWPGDVTGISEALAIRGAPQWMNWFPAGHELAGRFGLPDGQTAADLRDENEEHLAEIMAWQTAGELARSDTREGLVR